MKKNFKWFLFCSLPFFLFFLQFPLQHSLTGDLDGIGNLAMYKELQYWLNCKISGEIYTSICYPVQHVWKYLGADFGIGIIHIFFNYLGFNDLWSHYLFMSILFSLNAIALFLFIRILYDSSSIAFIGSLIFNFCHFTLANLENPNTLVFFLSFISLYYLMKYYINKKKPNKPLYLSIFYGAILIYFSPYNFLFHAIITSIFVIYFDYKRLISLKYILFALAYLLIISPFIYLFVLDSSIHNSYNVVAERDIIFALSFGLDDLYRVLPNHLYFKHETSNGYPWVWKIKSAYIGIFFYLIVFLGIFKLQIKDKKLFVTLIIIGFLVAFGPFLTFKFKNIAPSLMYPFYEFLGFVDILRIPLRAFFITLLGFTFILCGVLVQIEKQSKMAVYVLFALIIFENVPFKMETYKQTPILYPNSMLLEQLKIVQPQLVLNLPSNLFDYRSDRREYIYMYWHHIYKCAIMNGSLGFIPDERMNTYHILKKNDVAGILQLQTDYPIDCIVFHKDMIYTSEERKLLDGMLLDSIHFEVIFDSDKKTMFRPI